MGLRAGPQPAGALARCRLVEEGAAEQGADPIEVAPSEAGRKCGLGPMEGAEAIKKKKKKRSKFSKSDYGQ
jgi:hypothetical protein